MVAGLILTSVVIGVTTRGHGKATRLPLHSWHPLSPTPQPLGHGRREEMICPTVTWGFLSPPRIPKRYLAAVFPAKLLRGIRKHQDPEWGQEPMCYCSSGPVHVPF